MGGVLCAYAHFAPFNPTKMLALECIPTRLSYMPQALKLKPLHDVITFQHQFPIILVDSTYLDLNSPISQNERKF